MPEQDPLRLEALRQGAKRKFAIGLISLAGLTGGIVGCGNAESSSNSSKGNGTEKTAKNSQPERNYENPDTEESLPESITIDTSIDPCEDNGIDEKMQDAIDGDVYCYNQSGSNNKGSVTLSSWILDIYDNPDDLPYGASKGTVFLVQNITPEGPQEVQKDYRFAIINMGGQPIQVAGLDCSFIPDQYNLTCYQNSAEAAINLNGDADATIETYRGVMETALGYVEE